MIKQLQSLMVLVIFFGWQSAYSQNESEDKKLYFETGGELLFQFNDVQSDSSSINSPLRFTAFFHFSRDVHYNFSNNIGLVSGIAVRNIGTITDEKIKDVNYKIIRRAYTLGVPLAVKLGSFKDHFFVFGGMEYEMVFHYKQKYWQGTTNRQGTKTKYNEWFGDQTPRFMPSFFAGVQLPGGVNLKFKMYLNDFYNHDYTGEFRTDVDNTVNDLSRYKQSQLYYVSLSFHLSEKMIKDLQSAAREPQRAHIMY